MIFFYGEGRFGNQVFQYQALRYLARGRERVLAVGLEDLERHFELSGPRVAVLTRLWLVKRAIKYLLLPLVLRPLARTLRLVTYVHETQDGKAPHRGYSGTLDVRRGLLRRITFVDGGYYHNSCIWTSLFPLGSFAVRSFLQRKARGYLDSICGAAVRPAFIHIRRGDYLGYRAYGVSDLLLPTEFYRRAIDELRRRLGNIPLVFVTDDPQWVREHFADITEKHIPAFDAALDFAIMSECGSGVLSNSTFSLAAALMIRQPELLIAPQYWFGFRAGRWLPPRIHIPHEKVIYLPPMAGAASL